MTDATEPAAQTPIAEPTVTDMPDDTPSITVTASRDRWRGGRHFKRRQPVTLTAADVDEDEVRAIIADPVLSVTPPEFVEAMLAGEPDDPDAPQASRARTSRGRAAKGRSNSARSKG